MQTLARLAATALILIMMIGVGVNAFEYFGNGGFNGAFASVALNIFSHVAIEIVCGVLLFIVWKA